MLMCEPEMNTFEENKTETNQVRDGGYLMLLARLEHTQTFPASPGGSPATLEKDILVVKKTLVKGDDVPPVQDKAPEGHQASLAPASSSYKLGCQTCTPASCSAQSQKLCACSNT